MYIFLIQKSFKLHIAEIDTKFAKSIKIETLKSVRL